MEIERNRSNMFKPLEGVKVIDLTYFVAGPGGAKILADWGADVIKVEPCFGDPGRGTGATMSAPTKAKCNPFYSTYNANKRGLSINLKTEEGMAVLHKLLKTADVFVSSYRTEALKRLGLDYSTLHEKYPSLIWAQINGFGDFGPDKDKPGFDTIAFWARSGIMIDIAEKDTSPINPPIGFGDASTACSLAGGIAAALYRRAIKNEGCKVMVSLFSQALWSAGAVVASTQYGDEYPKSRLNAVSPVIDSFKCGDGKWIFLSILEPDRYNNTLLNVLGRDDLVDDSRFSTGAASKENGKEMIQIISEEFAKHTRDEIVEILTEADIAHEKIQHVKDVVNDSQALENKYIIPVRNLDGTETKLAMSPVRFSVNEPENIADIAPTIERLAPMIGEQSIEILKEYGYTDEDILALLDSKIIYIDPECSA